MQETPVIFKKLVSAKSIKRGDHIATTKDNLRTQKVTSVRTERRGALIIITAGEEEFQFLPSFKIRLYSPYPNKG